VSTKCAGSPVVEVAGATDVVAAVRLDFGALNNELLRRAKAHIRTTKWILSDSVIRVADSIRLVGGKTAHARTAGLERLLNAPPNQIWTYQGLCHELGVAYDGEGVDPLVARLVDEGFLAPHDLLSSASTSEFDVAASITELTDLLPELIARRRAPIDYDLVNLLGRVEGVLSSEVVAPADATGSASEKPWILDSLRTTGKGVIGSDAFREVQALYRVLASFSISWFDQRHEDFRAYLYRRYEGKLVPLAPELEPDSGFSFAPEPNICQSVRPEVTRALLALLHRAQDGIVELHDSDLPEVLPSLSVPPIGLSLAAQLVRTGAHGTHFVEPGFQRSPGTHFYARASAFSSELRQQLTDYLASQAAAAPETDVAQIVFSMRRRRAVGQFPLLAPWAISVSAGVSHHAERTLRAEDLLVRAGRYPSQGTTIVSRKTGRVVKVLNVGAIDGNRPGTAPLVRFLLTHAVARESVPPAFAWGVLRDAPFLPRVVYRGHVLSPKHWVLSAAAVAHIKAGRDPEQRFERLSVLRAARSLPRFVLFQEGGDHLLPVDLDDRLSAESWIDLLDGGEARLKENYARDKSAVSGPDGSYYHELVLPLLTSSPERQQPAAPPDRESFDERAAFDQVLPGQECLYLAVYGVRTELMTRVLSLAHEAIREGRSAGKVESWFFLPFKDPDPHLRLRVFGPTAFLWSELLPALNARLTPLVQRRVVSRVDVKTYERESARYGGAELMKACEKVFEVSSEIAFAFHARQGSMSHSSPYSVIADVSRSALCMVQLAVEDPEHWRPQLMQAAARYTRGADRLAPRRIAGDLHRNSKESVLPRPAEVWGAAEAERMSLALKDVQRLCESGRSSRPLTTIVTDLMHVHTLRQLTNWFGVPDAEAIAYFLAEKLLARHQHLSRR
jgi:thiopeptide-type bacteriocin biosynthesis protein